MVFLVLHSLQLYFTCTCGQYRSHELVPTLRMKGAPANQKMLHLDYISCLLTILSTILIGKRLWQGWILAAVNSLIICIIGVQTAQYGFLPGNLLCIGLYAHNLSSWRPGSQKESVSSSALNQDRGAPEQSAS